MKLNNTNYFDFEILCNIEKICPFWFFNKETYARECNKGFVL